MSAFSILYILIIILIVRIFSFGKLVKSLFAISKFFKLNGQLKKKRVNGFVGNSYDLVRPRFWFSLT